MENKWKMHNSEEFSSKLDDLVSLLAAETKMKVKRLIATLNYSFDKVEYKDARGNKYTADASEVLSDWHNNHLEISGGPGCVYIAIDSALDENDKEFSMEKLATTTSSFHLQQSNYVSKVFPILLAVLAAIIVGAWINIEISRGDASPIIHFFNFMQYAGLSWFVSVAVASALGYLVGKYLFSPIIFNIWVKTKGKETLLLAQKIVCEFLDQNLERM